MASNDKYIVIKQRFEMHRDEENAIKMAKYMRNLFAFYGLPAPMRKAQYKTFLKEEKRSGLIDWAFLDICYNDTYREFQYLVIDYLSELQGLLGYQDAVKIKDYITAKPWWDTIDGLDKVVGNIAFVDERINDLMLEWSQDDDFWVRRVAIDHQLCRKDKTNTALLEQILVNNFGSEEFFINKAIGWSLRDYSKTNPNWVKAFIKRYGVQMDKLSLKEAGKYI